MKISKQEFVNALTHSLQQLKDEGDGSLANYKANLKHNAGRWNYWEINKVEIDGVTYYCSPCCKTANSSLAAVKRVCARS